MIFICFLRKSNTTNDESSSAFLQTNTISTQFSIFTISIQYFLSNQTEITHQRSASTTHFFGFYFRFFCHILLADWLIIYYWFTVKYSAYAKICVVPSTTQKYELPSWSLDLLSGSGPGFHQNWHWWEHAFTPAFSSPWWRRPETLASSSDEQKWRCCFSGSSASHSTRAPTVTCSSVPTFSTYRVPSTYSAHSLRSSVDGNSLSFVSLTTRS